MTDDIPGISRTYTLPLASAAKAAGVEPEKLMDLVHANMLPMLTFPSQSNDAGPEKWFNVDDISDLGRRVSAGDLQREQGRNALAADVLRRYLEECPPVADYDEAMRKGLPLLSADRAGRLYAHVLVEFLADFAKANNLHIQTRFEAILRKALESMGIKLHRGIRPLGDDQQRWNPWYRVPRYFWSLDASEELGVREEILTRAGKSGGITLEPEPEPITHDPFAVGYEDDDSPLEVGEDGFPTPPTPGGGK